VCVFVVYVVCVVCVVCFCVVWVPVSLCVCVVFCWCVCVCVRASLAPERLDRFCSHSIYTHLLFIRHCPVNMTIPAPETGPLQISPKSKREIFSKAAPNDFDPISENYKRSSLCVKPHRFYLQKNNRMRTRG
jgi:hypothetical protein